MKLSELKPGEAGKIIRVSGHGAFRKRMIEMGFVKGREVTDMLQAPLNDPVKYSIMGYEVSLRRSEAAMVEVEPLSQCAVKPGGDKKTVDDCHREGGDHKGTITVALIGNPNCGKTSLFNVASGAREHVGNYSGVTVDTKTGHLKHGGYDFNIIDLPGTYSLASYSPEEKFVRKYLANHKPDVIVNVVDGSNLERNLYLTTELIDMNCPMVIALNMYDELLNSGAEFDYDTVGKMIGVSVVPTTARTGDGVDRLFDAIIRVYEDCDNIVRHVHVPLGKEIEACVQTLNTAIKEDKDILPLVSPRYLAIKLLENDSEAERIIADSSQGQAILQMRNELLAYLQKQFPMEEVSEMIAKEKYGFISGALAETYKEGKKDAQESTRIIDALVTNRLFGFPIFLAIMAAIFWATFQLGSYPMDWIEAGVAWLGGFVHRNMAEGPLKDLIADGIIGGVGGVIVFLPNIMILYFCISFMEDSGYMARAAFIMDKLMHKMGLHGKSFIPLIMGFGCNVPAIMSTRAIESRSSRLITILITPFMSCSARIPLYVLLVGVFCTQHATWAFLGLYTVGIVVAVITARMLRRFWFHADETPFVMELPPYRIPTFKASLRHTWAKGEQYLKKMGGVILVASIIVWALNYFPLHNEDSNTEATVAAREAVDTDNVINSQQDSYLEMAGKAINPVMEPCGFHWRATVAALAAIPAKEIVVSTLGVLYTGDEEASDNALGARITQSNPVTGQPDFNTASAWSFMLFILLYCPCFATVIAVAKEAGHWGYGLFSVGYNTVIAWIVAFATYQVISLFN